MPSFARLSCFAVISLLSLLAAASSAQAAIISYGGDETPNSTNYGPHFTTVVFGGTNWSSDGDVLTMQTAYAQGIWFGNLASYEFVDWTISDNAIGNKVTLRSRLTPGSKDWQAYLYDGNYGASFQFLENSVQILHATSSSPLVTLDIPLDTTAFHVYEFHLRDGQVAYRIDGQTVYHGPAAPNHQSRVLVVGDGSGSTISGVGSMQVDWLQIDTQPGEIVPEPATLALAAGGLLALAVAKRRRLRA